MMRFLPFILIGFLLGLACFGGMENNLSFGDSQGSAGSNPDLDPDESRTVAVFEKACRSVVFITSKRLERRGNLGWFGRGGPTEVHQGTGSGIIWDREGHVLTNYHVIHNADSLTVTLPNHTNWEAAIVGKSPSMDLAVLKIEAPENQFTPIEVGRSSTLKVGQKVLAIGNPFGLDQTLTTGIVSALGREIQSLTGSTIHNVIQTDAAINPGNSGGPLLDSMGRLIGVNTAIVSLSGTYAGIGFAVPVDTVARFVPQLIEYQGIIRPGLGIHILDDHYARQWGIEGVIIRDVESNSAAARAGLHGLVSGRGNDKYIGDVITGIDDDKVRNTDDLYKALENHKVGDVVTVHILKSAEKADSVKLKLQALRSQ